MFWNNKNDNEFRYEITDKEIEEYLKRKEVREYVKNKGIDYDFRFIKLEELKSFIDRNPTYVPCDLSNSFYDRNNSEDKRLWIWLYHYLRNEDVREFFDKYVLVMNLEKYNHETGKQ